MKINCVIVTYNRLSLLKECVVAIKEQTYPIERIFIIDNQSTDGTHEYLEALSDDQQFVIITLPENMGGAGGFSNGIRQAIRAGGDWIWVMDDDTIPSANALEELVKGIAVTDNVGYVCSKVVWTDGNVHKMNVPFFGPIGEDKLPINYYTNIAEVLLIQAASFVSLLINAKAVRQVGLPIKEFFIWGDDFEYTTRIFLHGYIGLYAEKSLVLHKTVVNYAASLETAPVEIAWKFRYAFRNKLFLRRKRKKNKILFFLSAINLYRRTVKKMKYRKIEDRQVFIKVLKQGLWESMTFTPYIEYPLD